MNSKMEEIGQRIRTARKNTGYSQADLSELLQISPSYMSDIENGKTNIGLDIFMRLTEVLHVSADWLLQTNTPSVNNMISAELEYTFSNCSADELKMYLSVIKEFKKYLATLDNP
uniref:helix-turn-helix domain-containing protein n=1 Tax=Acetatifactor sp. TaxID=1872090 RepID=UPI00405770C6